MNKKGLSPLIATILLIAFAVALGAMIMNWSSDFEEERIDTGVSSGVANPCKEVNVELNEAFGKDLFCTQDGFIKISLTNTGSKAITAVQLRIIEQDTTETTVDLKDSAMPRGGTFHTQYPFSIHGKIHAELVPKTGDAYCNAQSITKDILAPC